MFQNKTYEQNKRNKKVQQQEPVHSMYMKSSKQPHCVTENKQITLKYLFLSKIFGIKVEILAEKPNSKERS